MNNGVVEMVEEGGVFRCIGTAMVLAGDTPTLEPGFYLNYPQKLYHRLPYVSNSYLGKLDDCPAKARMKEKETKTLIFGRAFHAYTLEGLGQFEKEFAVLPEAAKGNSNVAKAVKAQFHLDNIGLDVITEEDRDEVFAMGDVANSHPSAREFLLEGLREVTIIWDHVCKDGTVIRCKARIDNIPLNAHGILSDLKSTKSAEELDFQRSIITYGYARQGAMYLDGINTVCRLLRSQGKEIPFAKDFDVFALVAVESEAPYRTEVYELDPDFIAWGQGEYLRLIEAERACRNARLPDGNRGAFYPPWKNAGVGVITKPGWLAGGV